MEWLVGLLVGLDPASGLVGAVLLGAAQGALRALGVEVRVSKQSASSSNNRKPRAPASIPKPE